MRIFQSGANWDGLHRDLMRAERTPWPEILHIPHGETNITEARFPFVTTCLLLGTSQHEEGTFSSRDALLPLNTQCKDVDNNDGISLYDITNPSDARYGFVFFEDGEQAGTHHDEDGEDGSDLESATDATRIPGMSVIDASTYLSAYYSSEQQEAMKAADLLARFDVIPLISITALQDLWPRENWKSTRSSTPCFDIAEDRPTLKKSTLARVVDEAIGSTEKDSAWLVEAEKLPGFLPAVFARLRSEPELIHRPAGVSFLIRALKGSTHVDLSVYVDLRPSQAMSIVEGVSTGAARCRTVLSLPDIPTWSLQDLQSIISAGTVISLHLGETPSIGLQAMLALIAHTPGIETFTCSALYRRALGFAGFHSLNFDLVPDPACFPCGKGTRYPLSQAIYIRQHPLDDPNQNLPRLDDRGVIWSQHFASIEPGYTASDFHQGGLFLLSMPLRDAMLTVERICCDLPEGLRGAFAADDGAFMPIMGQYLGHGLAKHLALGKGLAAGPIPGEIYAEYTRCGRSSREVPPPVHSLKRGEWTLLIIHERPSPYSIPSGVQSQAVVHSLRYAFVTIGEEGAIKAVAADDFIRTATAEYAGGTERAVEPLVTAWNRDIQLHAYEAMRREKQRPDYSICTLAEANEAFALLALYNKAIEDHEEKNAHLRAAWESRSRYYRRG